MPTPDPNGILPDYERPPVVETVLGIQFDQIPGFGNAHLGSFWKTLDTAKWPNVADAPPLHSEAEQFGDAVRWPSHLKIQLTQDPRSRLQIRDPLGDRMIQIQNGRCHYNWLGQGGSDYPRYLAVRDGFEEVLRRFVQFVRQEKIGEFRPKQWEVTYINNIRKGTVWNAPSDWSFFRPLGAVPTVGDVVQGESFSGEWHFIIPGNRGRLHANWQHGFAPVDGQVRQDTVWLTLTARGPVDGGGDPLPAILSGLDLGHQTIVKSFRAFMSDEANTFWGLKP
ncbi:MAG: TIGR04255 family protein [Planctomycetota bacterium]|nr:TIGR04255 family protein [Planctomycetota bacterium]